MAKYEAFDLGIAGINGYVAYYDPRTAIITLPRPRVLLPGKDHNTYVHGTVKRNPIDPGCAESQTLGLEIASLPAVVRVRFNKDYGVVIKLRYTPDRAINTLRRAARLILDAADANEHRCGLHP